MKLPQERVKDDVNFYFEYHHRLRDFYSIEKYFYSPDTEKERFITNNDAFFLITAYATWALVVVDLCKIFSDSQNQKHNIIKLLNDIRTKPEYNPILLKVGENSLDKYLEKINLKQNTIDKLKILRDKHYVHVDNLELDLNELQNPTFQETEDLLNLLKEIVTSIGHNAFNIHYDFSETSDSGNFNPMRIIQDIVRQRQ